MILGGNISRWQRCRKATLSIQPYRTFQELGAAPWPLLSALLEFGGFLLCYYGVLWPEL